MLTLPENVIKTAFEKTPFFSGKTWRYAPDALTLPEGLESELPLIGAAALEFYKALEKLYVASFSGKKILRNGNLRADWVAPLMDRGKPARLIAHQRSRALAGTLPPVIRPDLLICEDGFALTELDSVPGGIGLTSYLYRLYGGSDIMPKLFFSSVTKNPTATIAIAVSDEAADYRSELEWLAGELRPLGANVHVCHPNELTISEGGVFLSNERVDTIYRFFELFDLDNVDGIDALFDAVEQGSVNVTPPMRPFQEEKMSLALLHHPALFPYWEEALGCEHFALLRKIVPEAWVVEPVPRGGLPAAAVLHAPTCGGRAIRDWTELAAAARRDRNLVLKVSGFCEDAWGARSVTIGSDASQREWSDAVLQALDSAETKNSLYVLQRFRKPTCLPYNAFDDAGRSVPASGRARICPYYFVEGRGAHAEAKFGGALCTLCPSDKKIIHGMSDAVLLPVNYS